MPKPKKTAGELTDKEAMRKLFPAGVRKEAKKTAEKSRKGASKDQRK